MNTIGIVVVAALAASVAGVPPVTITFTPWRTRSAAIDVASFAQAAAVRTHTVPVRIRRTAVEEPYHWHRRLLGTRRERPCHRRTAHERDELASLQ